MAEADEPVTVLPELDLDQASATAEGHVHRPVGAYLAPSTTDAEAVTMCLDHDPFGLPAVQDYLPIGLHAGRVGARHLGASAGVPTIRGVGMKRQQ